MELCADRYLVSFCLVYLKIKMMSLRQITLILLKNTNDGNKIRKYFHGAVNRVYSLVHLCYVYFKSDCRVQLMITYNEFCVGYVCLLCAQSFKLISKIKIQF